MDADPPPCDPELLRDTVALVTEAAGLALDGWRRADLDVASKVDGTPVTEYDRLVERTLRDGIAARHPGDAVAGEEEGESAGTSARRWVIDPIDGTHPYSIGAVTWGSLVACDDAHGPLLGVVACPWVGEVVAAGRGLGTWWGDRRVRTTERARTRGAVLVTSSFQMWPEGALARVEAAGVRVYTWGNAYGMALAATGRVDAFFDHGVQPWDLAPAPVLAAEAGGRFGALDGSPAVDRGSGLLAGTELFEPLRSALSGA